VEKAVKMSPEQVASLQERVMPLYKQAISLAEAELVSSQSVDVLSLDLTSAVVIVLMTPHQQQVHQSLDIIGHAVTTSEPTKSEQSELEGAHSTGSMSGFTSPVLEEKKCCLRRPVEAQPVLNDGLGKLVWEDVKQNLGSAQDLASLWESSHAHNSHEIKTDSTSVRVVPLFGAGVCEHPILVKRSDRFMRVESKWWQVGVTFHRIADKLKPFGYTVHKGGEGVVPQFVLNEEIYYPVDKAGGMARLSSTTMFKEPKFDSVSFSFPTILEYFPIRARFAHLSMTKLKLLDGFISRVVQAPPDEVLEVLSEFADRVIDRETERVSLMELAARVFVDLFADDAWSPARSPSCESFKGDCSGIRS